MVRLTLPFSGEYGGTPVHTVLDDFGSLRGASNARYVRAENGVEYVIKGPSLRTDHRYVAANELIAARLAGALGLPILDFAIATMGNKLFFASVYMTGGFIPHTTAELFAKCQNQNRVYDLLAFDVWLCNGDRHHENLIVRHFDARTNAPERHLLLLNDHSHCLVLPGESVSDLAPRRNARVGDHIRLEFVRDAIKKPEAMAAAIAGIARVQAGAITHAVQTLPPEFLPTNEQGQVLDFLLARRDKLSDIFNRDIADLPNLQGATI